MQELFSHLQNLGLTQYEASGYMALLGLGEATAPRVSRESSIPLSRVYDTMEKLANRGFVLFSPDARPKVYKAVEPQIAINGCVRAACLRLEETKRTLLSKLTQIHQVPKERGIWIIRGRDSVETLMEKLISNAQKQVVIKHSSAHMATIKQFSRKLRERGVSVRCEPNDSASTLLNIDGQEMLIYSTLREALWIKDANYCKLVSKP